MSLLFDVVFVGGQVPCFILHDGHSILRRSPIHPTSLTLNLGKTPASMRRSLPPSQRGEGCCADSPVWLVRLAWGKAVDCPRHTAYPQQWLAAQQEG